MTTPIEPLGPAETAAQATARAFDEPKRPATMGELFATLSSQVTTLVNGEIELNKVKAKNFFKKAGVGGALLAVAGVLALYLVGWVFHTIEVAIAAALPAWAAALITTGILLLIVAILAAVGAALLKKSQAHKPDPKEGLTRDINALKKGLGK
ncbi:phage holin family protein [Actinomyces culturomici]|uniref:phage holin family protein n=1 Tax=Actinomyces culturomici TaxID=1926276 RepID=UPI000E1FD742|nr:phage holin family protein [Actinomyces culturomici]